MFVGNGGRKGEMMKTQKNRLVKLEEKTPVGEPEFHCWAHQTWTEAEKAEARRRAPKQMVFWKPLLEDLPYDLPGDNAHTKRVSWRDHLPPEP